MAWGWDPRARRYRDSTTGRFLPRMDVRCHIEHGVNGSGIYQITNQTNGHRYIGSAVNLKQRWAGHVSRLQQAMHPNRYLQNAWNKYGDGAFAFAVIERVEPDRLLEREQHYIDVLCPEYNLAKTAGSILGMTFPSEVGAKRGLLLRGRKKTEEHKRKIGLAHIGMRPSEETRRKIGEVQRGRKVSEESRRRRSKSLKGKRFTEEHRRKIGEANRGKQRSEAERRHLSEIQRGKYIGEETRRRMSVARKGRPRSDETRRKISEGRKRWWAEIKTRCTNGSDGA